MTTAYELAIWGRWYPVFKIMDWFATPIGCCVAAAAILILSIKIPTWISKINFPGPDIITMTIDDPVTVRRSDFDEYIKATQKRIKKAQKSRHKKPIFIFQ